MRLVFAGGILGAAGCATPGPLHLYTLEPAGRNIHDWSGGQTGEAPSYLEPEDTLTGFAYDPFTDHFFLRLAPGNAVRVVDRPARKIKREFTIEGIPASGPGGDLAIRPTTGHVFLLHPQEPVVFETTRLGKLVRTIALADTPAPPAAIACDARENQLLILHADRRRVTSHDPADGRKLSEVALAREVGPSLAFDSERREFYAPLVGAATVIGVFDAGGKFLRELPLAGSFVDAGPRSFVRVF